MEKLEKRIEVKGVVEEYKDKTIEELKEMKQERIKNMYKERNELWAFRDT